MPDAGQRTLIVVLAYKGHAAHGWQRQKDGAGVQQYLFEALTPIHEGKTPTVYGASRTDVGVHARMQVMVADVRADIVPRKWVKALNTALPDGIRARWAAWAEPGFRPRAGVGEKTYCYRFSFQATPDPFREAYCWWCPGDLDRRQMDALAASWLGRHDFAAARHRARSQSETTIRTLSRSEVIHRGEICEYWVRGHGFLTHQVRILAGTLIAHAQGRLSRAQIATALEYGDRGGLGQTAPARGLTLEHIDLTGVAVTDAWPGMPPEDYL